MTKIKFLVVRTVDQETRYNVVEAENALEAMKSDSMQQFMGRNSELDCEVATIGVYEIGAVNHLEHINQNMKLHSYYQQELNK